MRSRNSRRNRVLAFASGHPRVAGLAILIVAGLIAFVMIWFQPHKLFIDDTIDEAIPSAPSEGPGSGANGPARDDPGDRSRGIEPRELAAGDLRSLEHSTSGRALVLELADGRRWLRLEDLETSNGPDLRVYLSEIPAGDDWYAYGERFVDLGALKANIGDQNYRLPDDLDLSRYRSAVIWCRRFTVGFGVAPLEDLT